jgi:5'(3')-deoxyribonucleotidase
MKLFVDFDGTIVNARKAYFSVYESLYSHHQKYVHPNWEDKHSWDLKLMCPLVKEDLFEHDLFFYNLEFEQDADKYLKMLSKKYEIIICSIGTYKNIAKKSLWVKSKLPFIGKSIFINNGDNHMDKSIVDMKDGIIVDDVSSNLITSNAQGKICYGEVFAWNEDWDGIKCLNWKDLYEILIKFK